MFVPVLDRDQRPLMPTTPSRARRWLKSGKATAFWKGGLFCVRLNVNPSAREGQSIAVGIDPGSKREGYSVASAAHTYLNIQAEAREGVKEVEKDSTRMRRTRRHRKTPCRKPRPNRKQSKRKLPPSTRARWQWKLRLARFLCQLFPVQVFVVEDIAATTKKGKRRWNQGFSPLEVGKHWFYEEMRKLGPLHLMQGYETKALREQLGLKKSSKKLAEVWEAHCLDAWVLAYHIVGGNTLPDNRQVVCIAPFVWHHRQLHRFRPAKGGKRKPYGGTLSQGIKRGTLVTHPKWGKVTVGGTMDGRLSLHDPETNRRLTQVAKVMDCHAIKLLRWRTRLIPLHPSPKKGRLSLPPAEARGVSESRISMKGTNEIVNGTPQMNPRLERRIAEKKKQLDAYRPLDLGIVRRLHEDFRVEATYHSNAIEGNTLTLAETEMVLEYGLTIGGHPLREHLEVTNHARAYDTLERLANAPIDLETVLFLHRLVKAQIDEDAGQLRTGPVHIRGASFTPPPAKDLPLYLAQWTRWLHSDQALSYDPVTRAAVAHHDVERLHPFFDGNGRVGRLLLNIMLLQDGYPPALILRDWRQRYIQALQQASAGEYQAIIDLVGQAVELSLDRYLQACQEATAHLLSMKELAPIFETTVDYLGQLARGGKFAAQKRGLYWYARVEDVAGYFHEAQAQPRGRPRQKRRQE